MRELIRHILKESKLNLELIDIIKNENIFVAAELVGGLEYLKKILKDNPHFVELINSLKGSLNAIYHSRKQYIEFPMKFEIVNAKTNVWSTNSFPIINLIYDDSYFNEDEKKQFEMFLYNTIADLNIGDVDIKPIVRKMFKDKENYVAIDFVNGKYWTYLDHEIEYDDNDIKNLYLKYKQNNKLNESRRLTENEEDPTQKIISFLRRRYKVEEKDIGWEGNPILIKSVTFEVDGERYGISNFQNKITQVQQIFDMLIDSNVIEPIELYGKSNDPYRQKVIRAIKRFINQVM